MSADNGYIIRKHPKGGYAALHYFQSGIEDDGFPDVPEEETSYPTIAAAVSAVWNDWTEYGVNLHEEVYQ